jgi:hypothetical protein
MKKIALPLFLLLLSIPVSSALACDHDWDGPSIQGLHCDAPARWADRQDTRDARIAITTRDHHVTMMLTNRDVALQLSDHTFHKINRELRNKLRDDDDDDGLIGRTIKTAVLSVVRDVLDHSVECRVRDIRDVEYRNGVLIFTTEGGDRIFDSIQVDDDDAMANFSERDARAFVRAFHQVKVRS